MKINKNGFSLVETLIATVILSLVAGSLVYFLGNYNSSTRQQSAQTCQQMADSALELIRSAGDSGVFDYSNAHNRPLSSAAIPKEIFLADADKRMVDGIVTKRTELNRMNLTTMSGLDQLYNARVNSSPSICEGFSEVPHIRAAMTSVSHQVAQSKIFFNIKPVNRNTGQVMPCIKNGLWTRPDTLPGSRTLASQTNADYTVVARSDVGYQVTAQVVYTPEGARTSESCKASQKFFHNNVNPLPALLPAVQLVRNDQMECDATNFTPGGTITFKKTKQGTAFLCKVDSRPYATEYDRTPDYCSLRGCPGLQTQFVSASAIGTDQAGWIDCRDISRISSPCLGVGNMSTAYDPDSMTYSVQVPSLREHCEILVSVAEVDSANYISANAALARFQNPGRKPGKFSCTCEDGVGARRDWHICLPGYTQADCPRITGPHPSPSESYTPSPFLGACDCFRNSCSCSLYRNDHPCICDPGGCRCNPNQCKCPAYRNSHSDECNPPPPAPPATPPSASTCPNPPTCGPGQRLDGCSCVSVSCPTQVTCRGTSQTVSDCHGGLQVTISCTQGIAEYNDSNGCLRRQCGEWSCTRIERTCGNSCTPQPCGGGLTWNASKCACEYLACLPPCTGSGD